MNPTSRSKFEVSYLFSMNTKSMSSDFILKEKEYLVFPKMFTCSFHKIWTRYWPFLFPLAWAGMFSSFCTCVFKKGLKKQQHIQRHKRVIRHKYIFAVNTTAPTGKSGLENSRMFSISKTLRVSRRATMNRPFLDISIPFKIERGEWVYFLHCFTSLVWMDGSQVNN